MTGAMAGAAWGAATGVPSATGAPIIAGAIVVVPHREPRWSQLRKRVQQPVLAVVKATRANRINVFLIF